MNHSFFRNIDWVSVERKDFFSFPPILPAVDFALISDLDSENELYSYDNPIHPPDEMRDSGDCEGIVSIKGFEESSRSPIRKRKSLLPSVGRQKSIVFRYFFSYVTLSYLFDFLFFFFFFNIYLDSFIKTFSFFKIFDYFIFSHTN
jgi:hypothetical protein